MPQRRNGEPGEGRAWRAEEGDPGQWQEQRTQSGPEFGQTAASDPAGLPPEDHGLAREPVGDKEARGVLARGQDAAGPVWGEPPAPPPSLPPTRR